MSGSGTAREGGAALQHLIRAGRRLGLGRVAPGIVRRMLLELDQRALVRRQIRARVDDDTFLLAEFPRCGGTWMRFLLATMLHVRATGELKKLSRPEMYAYAPTLAGGEPVYRPYHFEGSRSLLKTHYRFHRGFKRAIVLYRDPFGAILSRYAFDLLDASGNPFDPVPGLEEHEVYLLRRAAEFKDYYESWYRPLRGRPDRYMAIRYEDMVEAPDRMILSMLRFVHVDPRGLEEAATQVAGMYSRAEVTPPDVRGVEGGKVALHDAVRRKAAIVERVRPCFTSATLERLDGRLHGRLMGLMDRLDALRVRPLGSPGPEAGSEATS